MVIKYIYTDSLPALFFKNAGQFLPGLIISEKIELKAQALSRILYSIKYAFKGFLPLPEKLDFCCG
jgi:hypothetical protein